ncbi:MAG: hypothetical protein ACI85U_003857, partial [Candidatus Promineifilaceae bacterium]
LYGLMYSLAIAFLFYNTLAKPEAEVDFVNLLSTVGAVAIIMVCPLWVDRVYRAGRMRYSFRWLMVIAYLFTLLILGSSAIGWYLYPDNSRWEPLTLILGFTISWLTMLQNGWREEDRIFAVFGFGDGS